MKYVIEGILTTQSPLHIASPTEGKKVDLDGRFDGKGKFPCTPIQEMFIGGIASAGSLNADSSDKGVFPDDGDEDAETTGKPAESAVAIGGGSVPVIPANSIRGRLRRFAARRVFAALEAKGEKLSLGAYHALTCGAVTGKPEGTQPSVRDALAAYKHPFIGIFGGGPQLFRSALRTDTGWFVSPRTLGSVVPRDYVEYSSGRDGRGSGRQVLFFCRKDDVLKFVDPRAERIIDNYADNVDGWQELVRETRKRKDEDENQKKIALDGLTAVEVVVPRTNFFFRVELDTEQVGAAGLGLLLLAIVDLANDQKLGGWTRNGFGRFALDLSISDETGGEKKNVLVLNNGRYELASNDLAQAADQAWNEAASGLDAATFENMFRVREAMAAAVPAVPAAGDLEQDTPESEEAGETQKKASKKKTKSRR